MSIQVSTNTPNKRNIAAVLRTVADWIEESGNPTVSVNLKVTFEHSKKEAEKNEVP